jgi:hypothetical protein
MSHYDSEQIRKDISTIVSAKGQRVQQGFYTVGVYTSEKYGMKITDRYTMIPVVEISGEYVDLDNVEMDSFFGKWVLNNVIAIEDNMRKKHIIREKNYEYHFFD